MWFTRVKICWTKSLSLLYLHIKESQYSAWPLNKVAKSSLALGNNFLKSGKIEKAKHYITTLQPWHWNNTFFLKNNRNYKHIFKTKEGKEETKRRRKKYLSLGTVPSHITSTARDTNSELFERWQRTMWLMVDGLLSIWKQDEVCVDIEEENMKEEDIEIIKHTILFLFHVCSHKHLK